MSDSIVNKSSTLRPEEFASTVVEVSHLYGFLALLFRQETTSELLRTLRSSEMQQDLHNIGIEFDDEFLTGNEESLLEDLAVEYAALFLGPGGHVNTHESVQADKDGYLWGERTAAVRDFIESSGLGYSENFNGIPDHISVELEFLSKLTHFESQDWDSKNIARAINCLEYQEEFLTKHLGVWYEAFCNQVIERAGLPFYRLMAEMLRDFIKSEIEDVTLRLDNATQLLSTIDTSKCHSGAATANASSFEAMPAH